MEPRFDPLYEKAVHPTEIGSVAVYCAGRPRFIDADLAEVARAKGTTAAWAEAFARHGAAAPARVTGNFAVAVGDARGRMLLAVDRFAICNLYYRVDGGQLRYDGRADRLAGDDELDPQALFDYLYFHVVPAPRTVCAAVRRIPAGHYVLWDRGTLTTAAWWTPTFVEDGRAPLADLRIEFKELLREAVANHSQEGRVGCFLSGGTDSSTVAGMLAQATGRAPPTFSIGFDAAGYDEMEYARIAARHFKADHHEYYVTPDDVADAVPKLAAAADQPFGNSSLVPAYYCAKMARDGGIDTMLAGDGGDELFGGNTRYAWQRVLGAYEGIPHFARKHLLEGSWKDNALVERIPVLRKAASYVKQASIPMPDRLQSYNLLARIGLEEIFTADFLAAIDPAQPLREQRAVYGGTEGKALVNRMLAYDWKYTLADTDLPKVNLATSVAGVACAFPLLDDRLVDFSLRLAPSLKLRRLTLRWFFKDALKDFLPKEIIAKSKHGFGLPFGVWMTRHARLRETALESIDLLRGTRILRPDFLARLTSDLLPRAPGYYGELVWILMMLGQWHGQRGTRQAIVRQAIDPEPPRIHSG